MMKSIGSRQLTRLSENATSSHQSDARCVGQFCPEASIMGDNITSRKYFVVAPIYIAFSFKLFHYSLGDLVTNS